MTDLIYTKSSVRSSVIVIGSAFIAVIRWFQRMTAQARDGPADAAVEEIWRYIKDQSNGLMNHSEWSAEVI